MFILLFDYCRLQITIYYGGPKVRYCFWNAISNGEERKHFGNWTGKCTVDQVYWKLLEGV